MEKFLSDLKNVMEKYNADVTVLDEYEVDKDFITYVIEPYFAKDKTRVTSVDQVQVFDGPHVSTISTSLSIRFDVQVMPDYNIQEERNMMIFVKTPAFEGRVELAARLCYKEIEVYRDLFADMKAFLDHPIKGPYMPPLTQVVFTSSREENPLNSILVLTNITEEGFYSPRDRFLDKLELRSVLKTLAKFHADGIKFLRETKPEKYPFMKADTGRAECIRILLDKYLDPYLAYLEQFTPVRPAVLLLKDMRKKGTILHSVFGEMEDINKNFHTICHKNLWSGNLFLKSQDLTSHKVVLVDWTHAQFAPLTVDVIHLLFTCGGNIAEDMTEALNDYYDYLKGHLAGHQLDRNNLGIDFETFWAVVGKTMRAEFVEEAVITPLVILCGDIAADEEISGDDLTDIFDNDLVEEDVLPLLEMAMSLGLTSSVEKLDPELFTAASRRGSILTGKLVTKKESMKEPLSACLRRRRSSIAPRNQRRPSMSKDDGDTGSRTGSPGNTTPRSGGMSRRESADPNSEAMDALRNFQLRNSKMYKSATKSPTESLGTALKMIKKRRSLFEHASVYGYGAW